MLCPQAAGVRIGLIFNPTAQGDKARFLQQQLDEIRDECVLMPTEGPGHAEVLAEEAVADGCEVVVAAGGDGTLLHRFCTVADLRGMARYLSDLRFFGERAILDP